MTHDFLKKYPIEEGDNVLVTFPKNNPLSMQAIRKKMLGENISDEEIDAIVDDIQNNKLSDLVLAYYTATSFFYKSDPHELAYTTKATAYTGDMYRFPGKVAGKYSIGGVPGNETTMIIIPILASLGITVPKTFSKAITSPAATGECVNVLMNISFKKSEIIRMTDKNKACLVWNEGLNLAPANDRIIKVSSPLGMEPYARMISSIMAKNYAMGINHCLIDIPMGPTAKVASMEDAERVAKHFRDIGEYLGIKMDVQITLADQPVGRGIGACLQAREALRILQSHPDQSEDLAEKAVFLAARMVVLCGLAPTMQKAERMVIKQLNSGAARKKMSQIIEAQGGADPDIKADEIKLGKLVYEVKAEQEGHISNVDMKYLNMIVRTLGAPAEYKAGIYLEKKVGDKIKKGDLLYTLYSESETKMARAKEMLKQVDFYTYEVKK
ncbi:MAG: thymidine phosphorylase [Candidatus Peribacteria bacterium]|nr:thymidine phosphorylase [Candidatus Peribacteria bacterium]